MITDEAIENLIEEGEKLGLEAEDTKQIIDILNEAMIKTSAIYEKAKSRKILH